MSLKTWAASGVSADNAHGVIRPTGRSGCRRAPGPPGILADSHRAGVQLADSACTSPNIACRRSRQASQGAQFVEADAGEDFHAAQRIGAAQGLLQLAGTAGQGAGANGGSAALDGMRGRGAASTSPSPSWRSSWAKRSCMSGTKRRNTGRSSSRLPPNARRYRPRLDQFARVRCRCRRALAPLLPR